MTDCIFQTNSLQRLLFWLYLAFSRIAAAVLSPIKSETRAELNARAERLLNDHGSSILRLSYSYLHNMSDAEEVLSDTLISFIRFAPVFENERHERAWLLRVAANHSKNRLKYNQINGTDELSEALVADEREDLSFVWDAVKQLPVKYREVIHLFYYEGFSTA